MQEGKLGKTPSIEELKEAYKCTGWDNVEINKRIQLSILQKHAQALMLEESQKDLRQNM